VIQELASHGITIAIESYCIEEENLSDLMKFTVPTMKIHGAFMRDIDVSVRNQAIVSAMISLGNALGMRVRAEALETVNQLTTLRTISGNKVQGFVLGSPVPADQFLSALSLHIGNRETQ
jgi:EAL domain-containing protein (putative c-di-GMP-specific phosphodiesterase class I)